MELDLPRFYQACNPSKPLYIGNETDRRYYIDFSDLRGGNIIRQLGRTISLLSPEEPTCQLFTGHIGCGKSTELLRLKADLEAQGFHVVYFESSQDLDLVDVDITDILLAIARQVSESLEKQQVHLYPTGFKKMLKEAADLLQTSIEITGEASVPGVGNINVSSEGKAELSLPMGIGKITAKTKDSPRMRSVLRQYLEPRTNNILEITNQELLQTANEKLKQQGKKGLVVIVDNLDRLDNSPKPWGRPQPEYLFVDRGEQLAKLNCHLVYTIPLSLIFSNDLSRLTNRFGVKPKVLPMVPVRQRSGESCDRGIRLLRQMILARAFPNANPEKRLQMVDKVFDSTETLDRLCQVSGGHVRNLLGLLYSCLQQEDPPLGRESVENVIREYRDDLVAAITDDEWELLFQALREKNVRGDEDYQILLRSMFLYEYRDEQGRWFWINPALAETKIFQDAAHRL
jgi:hypothetical protein